MSKRISPAVRLPRSISPRPPSRKVHAIIEMPMGSRNKFNFDEACGLFKLGRALPAGAVFPFNFGFVPFTAGGDGDPLDVLVLMDEPAFVGCLVRARLIGVLEAEQTERDGQRARNDRLIAVVAKAYSDARLRSLRRVGDELMKEIEHFFISYNTFRGKEFKPLGKYGPARATKVLAQGMARHCQQHALLRRS
jgi:inorganic pyrophosphatase